MTSSATSNPFLSHPLIPSHLCTPAQAARSHLPRSDSSKSQPCVYHAVSRARNFPLITVVTLPNPTSIKPHSSLSSGIGHLAISAAGHSLGRFFLMKDSSARWLFQHEQQSRLVTCDTPTLSHEVAQKEGEGGRGRR